MSNPADPQQPTPDRPSGGPDPRPETAVLPAREQSTDSIFETEAFVQQPLAADAPTPAEAAVPRAFGRYEVRQVLAAGAFGAVYLGHDAQLDRPVAIKVPRHGASAQQLEDFLREARCAAQLRHPGIVTIYDVGVAEGRCYIVSDLLQGPTLRKWMVEAPRPWQAAVRIVADVADALAHAHAHRTVHRDIKPENIILRDGQQPVVVDFGLGLSDSDALDTQRGLIAGTLPYMSPEQVRGLAHRIDGRTDIYSLGVILYELLCARLPFGSREPQELWRQIVEDEPQPPRQLVPGLPRLLEQICLKALAKELAQRYTTAGDLAHELRQVLSAAAADGADRGPLPPPADGAAPPLGSATVGSLSSVRKSRESERRPVTLLYCKFELDGGDDALAGLDAEEQNEMVQQFRELCAEAVQHFAGTTVPTAAEDLLVCFGYPQAQEDSGLRAVRTGRAILAEVARRNQDWQNRLGVQFQVSLVIHSGLAVVGETPTTGGSVISVVGESPTIVTRVQAAAGQFGVMLVSQATRRLIQGFFQCERVGSVPVKGIPEPLEIFRVVSQTQAHSRIDAAAQTGLTPLVGRDLEVSLLQKHWADASEGLGQVVLLAGDAGLGKSRLLYVLKEHVQQSAADAPPMVVEWRCSPYYQNTGLFPVSDYFQEAVGLGREDEPAVRWDKLEDYFQRQPAGRLSDVVPLFGALLSLPQDSRHPPLNLSPAGLKQRTLDALVNWLGQRADHQPVLFIVEDLHWSDPSTLELLQLLVEQTAGQRVLAVFTFRPEFTVPWSTRAHQTQLTLSRLRKQQVVELMQRQTGSQRLPPAFIEQIADRTGGVPLFVEEYTKMLLDTGGLTVADGQLTQTAAFSLAAIPATLQDLLLTRLDRLGSLHDVAQLGAAVGREFAYDMIRAVVECGESQLQEELTKLVSGEVLFQRGRPPQSSYQFKHALLQDAAYQSMLKKKRQRSHARIAHVLQTEFSATAETQPELLAHHWTEAGRAPEAIPFWLKAGVRSQMRSANREAIEQFQRGLQLLATLPPNPQRDQQELEFLVPLGVVLMAAKGYAAPEVGDCFGRARQLCEALKATVRLFFVLRGMWAWRLLRDELDQCSELCDEALRLAETPEGRELQTEAHFLPGNTHYYRGDFVRSLRHLEAGWAQFEVERSCRHARHTGLNSGVTILCHMGLALWQLGFPDQAFQRLQQAQALADQLAHPFSRAFALYHRRRVEQYCRFVERVEKTLEAEWALAHEQGFVFREAQVLMCRATCLLRQGKTEEALRQLRQGEEIYRTTGAKLSLTHHLSYLAETYLDLGQPDAAEAALEKAAEVQRRSTERYLEAELLRLRGEVLRARSPAAAAEAETCFQTAMQIAVRQQAKSRELRIALGWSRLLQDRGQAAAGLALLAPVYQWFSEGWDTPDLIAAKQMLETLRQAVSG